MRYFILGDNYAACGFVPQNATAEISEQEFNDAVSAIIASTQEPTDDATEEDFLEALTDLGVIP